MNLYTITQDFNDLLDMLNQAQEEGNQEQISLIESGLEITQDNFKDKATNYVKFIRSEEAGLSAIDEEIKRLTALKKSKVSKIDNLEARLSNSMQSIGLDKYDLGLFKLSFRKSTSVEVLDIELLSDDFKRLKTTVDADKVAIKKAIEAGQEVTGVSIKHSASLQIK
jgi:hypothetical protein